MDKFKKYLSAAIGSVILVLMLTFTNVGQVVAEPPGKDVKVINMLSEPVPIAAQGTTSIVGNVNITNEPLLVRNVDNPASQPFQAEVAFDIPVGSTSKTLTLAVVPPGKRLVIEYATVIAEVPSDQKMGARISTTAAGEFVAHHFVLTEQGPLWGVPAFAASQPMRVYADPGTAVLGILFRSGTTGTSGGYMSISGHLVNVP